MLFAGCGVKDYEGNSYKTVKIGNQVWIAENLKASTEKGSWCYNNVPENCEKYGRLYTWVAAMAFPDSCYNSKCETLEKNHQGICPNGFHIPTIEEFNKLYDYVGGIEIAALKLMSKENWAKEDFANDEDEFDRFGFNMLLGGYMANENVNANSIDNGIFCHEGRYSALWTQNNEGVIDTPFVWFVNGLKENLKENYDRAGLQNFSYRTKEIYKESLRKNGGFYLRCIKN